MKRPAIIIIIDITKKSVATANQKRPNDVLDNS